MRLLLILLLILLLTLNLLQAKKVALVIGNSNYIKKQLPNAKQDANDIASTLQSMGYDVVLATDVNNGKFDDAITNFHNRVIGAEIAVVFYAGHGIEIDKENYMIPLGVKGIYTRRDLSKLVKLSDLIAEAKIAKKFGVLFVDACRDNPLQNSIDPTMRSSVSRGLGQVSNTPSNILVSFATKAGATTADGEGSNSPYTQALKSFIGENDDIRFVIGRVKDWVVSNTKSSQHPQEPTMFGTLGGDRFCLSGICQQKVVIDNSENRRLREQIAVLKRQQQNVYVAPKVVVEQPVSVPLPKPISTSKWLKPTNSVCKANGGKLYKGICRANWKNAKKICSATGGQLPSREDFHKVIRDCGGIADANGDEWSENDDNSHYQNCYKQKGFSNNDLYWTREEKNSSGAWSVYFEVGTGSWGSKSLGIYALCVR